jgi:hypothetical protein
MAYAKENKYERRMRATITVLAHILCLVTIVSVCGTFVILMRQNARIFSSDRYEARMRPPYAAPPITARDLSKSDPLSCIRDVCVPTSHYDFGCNRSPVVPPVYTTLDATVHLSSWLLVCSMPTSSNMLSNNSVPLSLTEQEFIVAEVNRYLERTRGTPIPDLIENTLLVDPGGVAVLAPLPHAHRCPMPPLVLPVFDGGAPFARPLALVPRAPLAGCRMSTSLTQGGLGRECCTIVLQRSLPIHLGSGWLMSLFWTWFFAINVCLAMHLLSEFWVIFAGGALAGLSQLLVPFWLVDQLLLSEHDWVLKQHVLGSKVRRGGQWKRGLVVDSGPLSDLLGAQVPPSTCFNPVLGLHDTYSARFCISLDPPALDMLSAPC